MRPLLDTAFFRCRRERPVAHHDWDVQQPKKGAGARIYSRPLRAERKGFLHPPGWRLHPK